MLKLFREKTVYLILIFCSFFAVLTSIFAKVFLGKTPCQLCLVTRYCYVVVFLLSILFYKVRLKFNYALLTVFLLLSVAFGFYHLGVESHWWKGPASCTAELPTLQNLGKLPIPDISYCDKVNFTILGISSTIWNFALMAFIFWISSIMTVLITYKRKHEN